MECPFCHPPRAPLGGMKIAFLATDLCPEHLEKSGIPAFERTHPLVDGVRECTATCGCCSLEDLDRRLAERATHQTVAPLPAPGGPEDGEQDGR